MLPAMYFKECPFWAYIHKNILAMMDKLLAMVIGQW